MNCLKNPFEHFLTPQTHSEMAFTVGFTIFCASIVMTGIVALFCWWNNRMDSSIKGYRYRGPE